jgi:amino acid transporter
VATVNVPEEFIDHTTVLAIREKSKLQKHFKRFDVLFFLVCTLVGVDTLGAVAANGPQGFTWLIFLGLFFFIPYGLLIAELGSSFPEEGGPYVWTRLAFGRLPAAINSVIYWVSNPIWLGGALTITAVAAFSEFFTPLEGIWKYLFSLAFIWTAVGAVILSTNIGKWVPTIGAFTRIFVFGFFTVSVVIYAIQNGINGFGSGEFAPSYAAFIALVPVLFFNYVGFELPSTAGEEMTNPKKDVPYAVIRSAILTLLLYGLPILGILLVLPADQITGLEGLLTAISTVFTVYGGSVAADGTVTLTGFGAVLGDIAAIAFILMLLSSGTTWIMGADRAMAAAGFDGSGPRSFGKISERFGTPVVVNLWTGVISTATMVAAYLFIGDNPNKYFAAALGLAISTTTISYLMIFPALSKLRKSHPHVERPYRVPGGRAGAVIASWITFAWAAFATVVLLWPGFGVGWFGTSGNANDSLLDYEFGVDERLQFELTQFVPLLFFIGVGVLFYVLGERTREEPVDIPFEEELAQDAHGGLDPA